MSRSEHVETIERKLSWLRTARQPGFLRTTIEEYGRIAETYVDILESSDTFFMDRHFCDLVDHARHDMPDNMPFVAKWLQAKRGWLWCATPFEVPPVVLEEQRTGQALRIRAMGWREVPDGATLVSYDGSQQPATPGSVQFCFYADVNLLRQNIGLPEMGPEFWSPWSFFVLRDGQLLAERLRDFEERGKLENAHAGRLPEAGGYIDTEERVAMKHHEMRWLFTALHLMSQRLAVTVEERVDRATRRRAERAGETVPPTIRIVTLRRLQQDREVEAHGNVDWQWRWTVRGHWRQQFYPSENVHRPVFIEAFIKGPEGKPLKPDTIKLFVARR